MKSKSPNVSNQHKCPHYHNSSGGVIITGIGDNIDSTEEQVMVATVTVDNVATNYYQVLPTRAQWQINNKMIDLPHTKYWIQLVKVLQGYYCFSVSPSHSGLLGAVVLMPHWGSVCCEFKTHRSLFDFTPSCNLIGRIRWIFLFKTEKTQLVLATIERNLFLIHLSGM